MTTPKTPENPASGTPVERDAARVASLVVREAVIASLATIDTGTGHPFATLVGVATAPDGTPLMLLSDLARHTRNIGADPRASLLFAAKPTESDALTAPRVTVVGRAKVSERDGAKQRYVRRHPDAGGYAEFADFRIFELDVEAAHLVAGFGRISTVPAAAIIGEAASADALLHAEREIVEHMNSDHADALALYAGRAPGTTDIRMTGIDPWGLDLRIDGAGQRITFATPITTTSDVRRILSELADEARRRSDC